MIGITPDITDVAVVRHGTLRLTFADGLVGEVDVLERTRGPVLRGLLRPMDLSGFVSTLRPAPSSGLEAPTSHRTRCTSGSGLVSGPTKTSPPEATPTRVAAHRRPTPSDPGAPRIRRPPPAGTSERPVVSDPNAQRTARRVRKIRDKWGWCTPAGRAPPSGSPPVLAPGVAPCRSDGRPSTRWRTHRTCPRAR